MKKNAKPKSVGPLKSPKSEAAPDRVRTIAVSSVTYDALRKRGMYGDSMDKIVTGLLAGK